MAGTTTPASAAGQQPESPIRPSTHMATTASTTVAASSSLVSPLVIETHFSSSQLALALSFAKSIPEGVSMQDYIAGLRKRIVLSSSIPDKTAMRTIDNCEFWKDLYEKVHRERVALQAENFHLKELLRSEYEVSPENEDRRSISHGKRHAIFDEDEESLEDESSDEIDLIGDPFFRLNGHTLGIHKQRRSLGDIVRNSDTPDQFEQISRTACSLVNLLQAALTDCYNMPLRLLKCDGEPYIVELFRKLMQALVLGFGSCFEALNELGRTIPGRAKRFSIEYGLLTFFQQGLEYLHSMSTLQAAEQQTSRERRQRHKRAKVDESEFAVNHHLSKALVKMTQMEWKTGNLSHSELLEGMLCSVLRHTGSLLSYTVFDEHVAESDKPGNISSGNSASMTEATRFEFRYIVRILYAALGGSSKRDLVVRIIDGRRYSSSASLGSFALSKAKSLLQNTLVKSAVGADVETLRLLELPEDFEPYSSGVGHRVEKYGSEWFGEAVWALVGWDLMTPKV